MFNKEFIWPSVIVVAFRPALAPLAFAKYGTQSHSYPAVNTFEYAFPAVFEIAEPADETWIQPGNYIVQTVSVCPFCDPANFIPKFVKALFARVAMAFLKLVAEKFKAFLRCINDPCLFRMERQSGLFRPLPYRFKGLFGLLSGLAKNYEVVCIPYHLPSLLLHFVVEGIQVYVGKQRADYRSLRCPLFGCPSFKAFHHFLLEILSYEFQYPSVGELPFNLRHELFLGNAVEVSFHGIGASPMPLTSDI